MSIHLTPDILEQAYELLRATPPFRGWKLPPADDLTFHVIATNSPAADHYCIEGVHTIRISHKRHKTLRTLIETMAHEMVHMREAQMKTRADVEHGKVFHRLADQVCRAHGFDRGMF